MKSWPHAVAAAGFAALSAALLMAFWYAPVAQCDAGCLTQKIFYFHVPSAYSMYLCIGACCLGSLFYLWQRNEPSAGLWDGIAQAGGELTLVFAAIIMTTGPLWGWKAWGKPWVWDPRLTSTLLCALIMVAYVVLRSAGGEGEKRFAAALSVVGTALMPLIHYSVQLWRGQHPTVITRRGGGVAPAMGQTLGLSFLAFTVLVVGLIALRYQMAKNEARLEALESEASALGLLDDEQEGAAS
ncbi:MAG: cytochrome c biogenesis protein CcsA [Polyangiales bacterium]